MPTNVLALSSFLMLFLLPTPTQARQQQARPNIVENLLQLDANGDQIIDREEVPESAREAFDKILEQADRNHNGKLESEELRGTLERLRDLGADAQAQARARFQAMDIDNDGKVSKAEFKGPEALFSRLDANADGFVDAQEAAQAYRQMSSRVNLDRLKQMDANNDGKITKAEFQGPEERFDQLDTNADGVLDQSDGRAQTPSPAPTTGAQNRPMLSRMDTDKDGKVTREEFTGPANFFNRLDKNSDGVLTAEEFPTAMSPAARPNSARRPAAGRVPAETFSPLMRLDKNKDGKLSRDEVDGRLARFFDRIDTNSDGFITQEEGAGAASRFRDRRPEPAPEPKAAETSSGQEPK